MAAQATNSSFVNLYTFDIILNLSVIQQDIYNNFKVAYKQILILRLCDLL